MGGVPPNPATISPILRNAPGLRHRPEPPAHRSQPLTIRQQRNQPLQQAPPPSTPPGAASPPHRPHHQLRILPLVVIRRRRKRHQQRRLARRSQLRHRTARSGTAPDPPPHTASAYQSETPSPPLSRIHPRARIRLSRRTQRPLARLVHDRQPRNPLQQPRRNPRHRLIEDLRPIAPRRNQQPSRAPAPLSAQRKSPPHRHPVTTALRKYLSVSAKFTAAALTYLPTSRFASPGTAFGSYASVGTRNRIAAIIAGPEAYPPTPITTSGLKLRTNSTHRITPSGRSANVRSLRRQAHILQLPNPNQLQRKTSLRHQPSLQPPRRPHKPHLGPMRIPQLPRNRQRRNHMPTGSPTSNQNPQRRLAFYSLFPTPYSSALNRSHA